MGFMYGLGYSTLGETCKPITDDRGPEGTAEMKLARSIIFRFGKENFWSVLRYFYVIFGMYFWSITFTNFSQQIPPQLEKAPGQERNVARRKTTRGGRSNYLSLT